MDSHPSSHNVAARMARWSSRHRKKAFWGWLAFVILAFAIGQSMGLNPISDVDNFNGESHDAEVALENAGLRPQSEVVFIQSDRFTVKDPQFRAAVQDVTSHLPKVPYVQNVKSPLEGRERGVRRRPRGARGLRRGGRFGRGPGPDRPGAGRCRGSPEASSRPRRGADRRRQLQEGGQQDDQRRPRERGHAVDPDHPDPSPDHVRLARGGLGAAVDRAQLRHRGARPGEHREPDRACRQQPARGDPVDRPCGGRGLLALLPEARAGGAGGRPERDGRARGLCRDVGPRRADLRRDGDRGDGRHVHQR